MKQCINENTCMNCDNNLYGNYNFVKCPDNVRWEFVIINSTLKVNDEK